MDKPVKYDSDATQSNIWGGVFLWSMFLDEHGDLPSEKKYIYNKND